MITFHGSSSNKPSKFEFDVNLIDIMCCVTSVSTAIIWDNEPLQEFKPQIGMQQGYPISPNLFVLCMERLSNMISFKDENKLWKGIEITRGGPSITHLFFADDLMLFGQATMSNCNTIMQVMDEFCDISIKLILTRPRCMFLLTLKEEELEI